MVADESANDVVWLHSQVAQSTHPLSGGPATMVDDPVRTRRDLVRHEGELA
jgi:hypothetical protein